MDNNIFLNNDVARLTDTTPRQVLAWTEKGLIIPFRETTGAGVKRGYSYINLLEVYLCKHLLHMGFGIQHIKNTLNNLRNRGYMQEWAANFNDYYLKGFDASKKMLQKQADELTRKKGSKENIQAIREILEQHYDKPNIPDKPTGILMIFYSYREGEKHIIIPWGINYAINQDIVKSSFIDSVAAIMIDLGKIKSFVDEKLKE